MYNLNFSHSVKPLIFLVVLINNVVYIFFYGIILILQVSLVK